MATLQLWILSCLSIILLEGSLIQAYGGDACVSTCLGKPDGKYQSCKNCHVYVTCTGGLLMDGWPCPQGLLWDDDNKNCQKNSGTCQEEQKPTQNTGCQCATSCEGLADGRYQSCEGCHVYALCESGLLYDNQPCPRYSFWDDSYKRCLFRSSTCGPHCHDQGKPYSPGTPPPRYATSPERYATRPTHRPRFTSPPPGDGDQQFQTPRQWPKWPKGTTRQPPHAGTPTPGRPTPISPSANAICRCITDCKGKEDGSYPSCVGCNYFAICFREVIYDSQECPANRVWNNAAKTCVEGAEFCKTECASGTTEAPEEEEDSPGGGYSLYKGVYRGAAGW